MQNSLLFKLYFKICIQIKMNVNFLYPQMSQPQTQSDHEIQTQTHPDQQIETLPDQHVQTQPDQQIETQPDQQVQTQPDQQIHTKAQQIDDGVILNLYFLPSPPHPQTHPEAQQLQIKAEVHTQPHSQHKPILPKPRKKNKTR